TQNSELRTQNSELRTQNSELRTQNSELRTQNSELRTQSLELGAWSLEFGSWTIDLSGIRKPARNFFRRGNFLLAFFLFLIPGFGEKVYRRHYVKVCTKGKSSYS
ncbi:MAG: hypothetical protein IJW57_05780, partial [Spirochaetaceae bacterium]|nr:hypothetical protein [Spirochaetaceae bacterium]